MNAINTEAAGLLLGATPRNMSCPPTHALVSGRMRMRERLVLECEAMMQHLLGAGAEMPHELFTRYDAYLQQHETDGSDQLSDIVTIHTDLCKLIAPARPAAILMLRQEAERSPFWSTFGPVPIVRHFLMLGGLSLAGLLAVSLSTYVNTVTLSKSFLEISGLQLLVAELFLLFAASLGSCFANLQKLRGYITDGTYDPKHQSSYWTRWVMGVISGILLSQMLYSAIGQVAGKTGDMSTAFGEPALALLGGYSADLVHRALNRLIAAVDTLLGGDTGRATP